MGETPPPRPLVNPTTPGPAYQPGHANNPTVIVLSAPGRLEEQAGHPAAGATGTNLNALLTILHDHHPNHFPHPTKDAYTIVNAHPHVEYPGKTGRSEATLKELATPENTRRLTLLLQPYDLALALGARAQEGVRIANFHGITLHGIHPGNQALNLTYKTTGTTGPQRRLNRIHAFAHHLTNQLPTSPDPLDKNQP